MFEPVSATLIGLSAVGLLRRPKRNFTTKTPLFHIHDVSEGVEFLLKYYTVDVDGRWSWPEVETSLRPNENGWYVNKDNTRVHAAKMEISFRESASDPWRYPKPLVLASEGYLAADRAEYVIHVHPICQLVLHNKTGCQINATVRYGWWGFSAKVPVEFSLAPGQRLENKVFGFGFGVSGISADGRRRWAEESFSMNGPCVSTSAARPFMVHEFT